MTTYNIRTISYYFKSDLIAFNYRPLYETISVPEGGGTLTYTYQTPGQPQDQRANLQSDAYPGSTFYSIAALEPGTTLRFEEVSWGAGYISQMMIVANGKAISHERMIFLGGDLLPTISNTPGLNAFLASITAITQISAGPFAPNQPISIKDIPILSIDEDDFIQGSYSVDPGPFRYDGGAGNDIIGGGALNDTLIGGEGADRMGGAGSNDRLYGGSGKDSLFGGDGNDLVLGGSENDSLDGGLGNDTLLGGGQTDKLLGGSGSDSLDGSGGNDILDGGLNADQLIFRKGSGSDLIGGFEDNSDSVLLDDFLWVGMGPLTVAQVLATFAHVQLVNGKPSVVLDFGQGDQLAFAAFGTISALEDDILIF